jgi:hypothetical protein
MRGRLAKLLLVSVVSVFSSAVFAQDLTGVWRGYFITDDGDNYKLECQVNLNKSKSSSGVSYSYLDVRFYGKATMTGFYDTKSKELKIQELKTVEVRNMGGGGTCLMNYKLVYAQSGQEEFLEGTYLGKQEGVKGSKWGSCGGGKVFLRRVINSDFHLEPFLRNKDLAKKTPNPQINTAPKKATPSQKPPVVKAPPKPPVAKTPTAKVPSIKKIDTIQNKKPEIIEQPKKLTIKPVSIPQQTRARENNLIKTIDVTNDEVVIKIYDNGEIDDDSVSVYLDNKLIIDRKRITDKPLTYSFKVSEDEPEHIVTMVADNLGRIPPNTSLMLVYDGDKRHEVFISTNEQKNAVIRFRYKKNDD